MGPAELAASHRSTTALAFSVISVWTENVFDNYRVIQRPTCGSTAVGRETAVSKTRHCCQRARIQFEKAVTSRYESGDGPREIKPPHPHEGLVEHKLYGVGGLLIAREPVFQCTRVMQAQIFYVQDRKTPRLQDLEHLGQGRRVRAREDIAFDPNKQRGRSVAADGMQQPPPVGAETAIDDHAELFEMGLAHVLQHTDGDEGVAVSLDGAVIGLDELNTPFYSLAACTLARIRDLLARDVIRAHIDLVMPRHVEREQI